MLHSVGVFQAAVCLPKVVIMMKCVLMIGVHLCSFRGGTLRSVLGYLVGLAQQPGGWRKVVLDRTTREMSRGNFVFPRGCSGPPSRPPVRSTGIQAPGAKAKARQAASMAPSVATSSVSLVPGSGSVLPTIVVGEEAFSVTGTSTTTMPPP